jgi:hypothetical protein
LFLFFDSIVGDFVARLMHAEIRAAPFNRKSRDGVSNHRSRELHVIDVCKFFPQRFVNLGLVSRRYRVCRDRRAIPAKWFAGGTIDGQHAQAIAPPAKPRAVEKHGFVNTGASARRANTWRRGLQDDSRA